MKRSVSVTPLPDHVAPTRPTGDGTDTGGAAKEASGTRVADTPVPSSRSASRFHLDTWLVARPTGGESLAFGQLGASQAGARATYAVGERRAVALSVRVSAPVRGAGAEAGVGIEWRPTRLPIHLLVEERVPLDGGRVEPAVQLIGGWAGPLPLGMRAEAYAQAGAVRRRGGFADGAARLALPVVSLGRATVDAGIGGWGAAQRRLSRLDVGPTAGVTVPMRERAVRLSVDYRLRVAGHARPGSGPAVTLGGSF